MSQDHEAHGPPGRACIGALTLALMGACSQQSPEPNESTLSAGPGHSTGATTEGSSSSSGGDTTTTAAADDAESSGDAESSSSGSMAPKLDIGPGETDGDGCADDDICCVQPGELPPHALLDQFLAAYPPEALPHNLAEMQSFVPSLDGMSLAYAALNTGDEIIDSDNGGLTDANLEAGRAISKNAVMAVVPADATIADVREDPPEYADLGGAGACYGVGAAWGSILFDASDGSIGELVYVYIGYCNSNDGDSEVFGYSDQATQICAPPD